MTYTVHSDSPYVVTTTNAPTAGGAPGHQIFVDPTPRITLTGNATLTSR